jgi:hypothetical protein
METDPPDFRLNCAYCSKPIPSEAGESGYFVTSGEEMDGTERIAILQPVCMECVKEKNLDKIMSDIISDVVNDGLKVKKPG